MKKTSKKGIFFNYLKIISTIISWTIFALLLICVVFLFYYFVATKIYATKGQKYEPKVSLYTIVSPSMTPNINVYDVIVNLKVNEPKDIAVNDVITFISTSPETEGMTITHRVISVIQDDNGNYSYQTKGDYAPVADSSAASFSNVIGKVSFKIPKLGRVQFFIAERMEYLFVLLAIALFIIIKDLVRTIKNSKLFNNLQLSITSKKRLLLPYTESIVDNPINIDIPISDDTLNIDITVFTDNDENIEDDLPDLK